MDLSAGKRLGPYEIVALIGRGGMGGGSRARDARLSRDVAPKALPDALASDPERPARFIREAQTAATLNHPLITQVHGLEESAHGHARAGCGETETLLESPALKWPRNVPELVDLDGNNPDDGAGGGRRRTFGQGAPARIVSSQYYPESSTRGYDLRADDIAPDGRFLMSKEAEPADQRRVAAPPAITVVIDWFEELTARVPANR